MSNEALDAFINFAYLIAAIFFIVGLKGLTHPRTAVRGNYFGGVGMLIAVVATLLHRDIVDPKLIFAGIAIGAVIGGILAVKIDMKVVPQLVATFNGFGGIASVFVAGAEAVRDTESEVVATQTLVALVASGIIGAVTFWGSLVAIGKFSELDFLDRLKFPLGQWLNALLALLLLLPAAWCINGTQPVLAYWLVVLVASILGVSLVVRIGGADMPVVVALLNSLSGLAAAATGFVLQNNILIITGALVGASGLILTQIMCRAMNRTLVSVLFTSFGTEGSASRDDAGLYATTKSTSADEVAMMLDTARRVVIVPGYGMAVAQAQHAVRDLSDLLESRGITVEFGIHPVAGRMPGHMNVLLAEANIRYDQMLEMQKINPTLAQVDMAIVIGANDVVNPSARTDPSSPIAGMPIIDVDKARTVVVIKRSLSPGFAGIPNPLFAAENTLMLFGDGRQAVQDLVAAIEEG
ncbi:NAD(P) transhydrogenase subunit beta [Symmachiella dynata]|uniref:NAD(P) transhydrogenase subunit beta n=1 Tax=Symmachiella dynata TaxID=2527995 RepID=A0A517ZN44_9PLAN|nr:NAD(P)(+) transhydrogenase (Re/Si-specific) subunit beta [Symmachiella dynata]QDU43897.1 NAD(P) transhydrogenase subunit beta [Symmachiella dynata]